ncbi:YjbH domain-containing protein [Dyadobacter flavalbus]|uniref:YjbH domain-containing protein n=1 Tax=Dyadobacter flavalbus TaxID=2579942 RepID=UPI001E5397A5|nr:YjbH domain-containing protein [Dyadobacter flavalbus]
MNNRTYLLFCLLVLNCTIRLAAQDSEKNDKLRNNFENVQIDTASSSIYYEQRLYRNPFIGVYKAKKAFSDTELNTFIPLFQGIPIGKYSLGRQLEYSPLTTAERNSQKRLNTFPFQKNNYKLDFWIQPYFAAIFGNFEKPVQSNTSVAIQSQFYILPGLSLQAGILFPITNDLDGRPKNIRPAPLFLNQFYASGYHYFSASAGFFQNDQYGFNVQYRHANLSSPWSFGLETGLTGFYYYPRGGIYNERLDKLLLIADASYRFAGPDLTFKVSGGHYLAGDVGARIELFRQFTNVEIGFYAMSTTNGSTIGFNFAIPVPPGKLLQGKHARLRTTDEFRWEYTYTRGYRIGERYRTGYQLDQKLRQYHRDYLNRQYRQLN